MPSIATVPARTGRADRDTAFVAMLDAFRPSGGLARADDLASQWRSRCPDSQLQLARWIAHGTALSFRWSHTHWLPLFQFAWPELALRPALAPVLAELQPVMEAWELAQWFSAPNGFLAGDAPADRLARDAAAVLAAARGDRFLLAG